MIRIDSLHKTLAGAAVLRGVDLTVDAGEVLALVGPSGTGKSVLLRHVIGLLQPDRGDVLVDGRSVAGCGSRELREIRRSMGYVFQDAALLDSLTVRQNLRLALDDADCARDPGLADHRMGASLAAVNLDPRVLDRRPGELSGGMRKRAGVARAIINEPRVLLYDEPTTGLDPRNVEAIHQLILANRDRFGATSVVITHDLPSLTRVADRVALLEGGRVIFSGSPQEFLACDDPAVASFNGHALAQEDGWQTTPAAVTR